MISAYARAGSVDHTVYDFTSVLKFIESRFGLSALTQRDGSAADVGKSLNLSQPPLKPFLIGGPLK